VTAARAHDACYARFVHAWITGAKGFVGSALAERLIHRGDEIVAVVRPGSGAHAPRGTRVVETELPDVAALEALPKPDLVFHCAGASDLNEADSHALHVEATLRLARVAPAARFVHLSTTDVLPVASDRPVSEDAPCAPRSAYGRSKLESERRLLAARPDAIVLRPPGVYGPRSERNVVIYMARAIERGTFFHLGDGRARRSWVFVDTLIDAMLHLALDARRAGVFFVDDGRALSRHELAHEIARLLGRRARFAHLPVSVACALGWAFEQAAARLGVSAPLTRDMVERRAMSLELDTSRLQATGFSPRFSTRDAIRTTLDWAREAGLLRARAH
jgi:nucleoside-diphosphate-sugar epimerase